MKLKNFKEIRDGGIVGCIKPHGPNKIVHPVEKNTISLVVFSDYFPHRD